MADRIMTSAELQELNQKRQFGIPVEQEEVQVPVKPKRQMVQTAPPPVTAEQVSFLDEEPEMTGQDLLGYERKGNQNLTREAAMEGWGQSRFDERNPYYSGMDLEDVRAREQSWANKVLSGATKGLATMGTTWANTTIGTLTGAFKLINPFLWEDSAGETIRQAINNPVSGWLNNVQRTMEEILPNYRTEQERSEEYQRQWYKPSHWITGNFIGDSFLKNFGFTAGAMLGGLTWGKLLGAVPANKLSEDLMKGVATAASGDAEAAAAVKAASDAVRNGVVVADAKAVADGVSKAASRSFWQPFGKQTSIAVIGALGEGNAEGQMARQEFLDEYLPQLEQRYSQELASLEEKLLQNKDYRQKVYIPTGPDTGETRYILNDEGQEALLKAQNDTFDKYQRMRQEALHQGDALAETTFLLNIPILTISNAVQFSRMLGGGWRSARKRAGSVLGRLGLKGGVPSANYSAVPKGVRIAQNIAKVSGAEATEEMLQGAASSGAKQVAEDRMTYFNDIAYDRKAVSTFRDWITSMSQGAADYAGDIKNWQEGFLGALTGLLGMPGKGYFRGERGGVVEAVRKAIDANSAEQAAADKLNTLVNSQAFKDRWDGYIRHLKFDDDIRKAVERNDEYAFHNADDAMLFNDVMAFAKAGKINDLLRMADRFSNLSEEDIKDIRDQLSEEKGEQVKDLDAEIKQRVEEQANKIKETIKSYSEIRGEMLTRLPVDASESIIDETVFTAAQIGNMESRFISLMDQTLDSLDAILGAKIDKPADSEEFKAELGRRKNELAKIFSGSLVSLDAKTREKDEETLKKLEGLVKDDNALTKKVQDMEKLYRSRQKFFDKLSKLESISNEEYAQEAQNQEKVQSAAEKEAAEEEAASMTSLGAVKAAFNKEDKRNLADVKPFIERMRKAKDSNPYVANFLNIYDAYTDLNSVYTRNYGQPDALAKYIISNVFENATSKGDMTNPSALENYSQYLSRVRNAFDPSVFRGDIDAALDQNTSFLNVSEETYNEEYNKILEAMRQLSSIQDSTEGRQENASPASETPEPTKTVTGNGKEPSQESSAGLDPSKKRSASIDSDGQSATDSDGRTWTIGETMYGYDSSKKNEPIKYTVTGFKTMPNGDVRMIANDGTRDKEFGLVNQTPFLHKELPSAVDTVEKTSDIRASESKPETIMDDAANYSGETSDEVKAGERETNESGEKMYYQTAIPEFDVEIARQWREAKTVEAKKAVIKKIVPFYQEGDEKKAGYRDIWNKLNSVWDAYTNAVKNVKVGDKVKLIANSDAGTFNGKPNILMAVEKDGQRYIFNLMRRTQNRTRYAGLSDLLEQFDAAYNAFIAQHPGQEFVFDKEATVWGKREGIVDYDYSPNYAGERAITEIPGYDDKAPIVWVNGNGEFETLRGDSKAVRNVDSFRNMSSRNRFEARGRIYYLADDGLGGYVPIRLGVEHFTLENYRNDNPKFNAIRESLMRMEGIAGNFFARVAEAQSEEERNAILTEENARLHNEVGELRKLVNITNGFFHLGFNNQGQPILLYDRNANSTDANKKFDGFYLGENGKNNISKLTETFAAENVSLDFYPKRNFRSMLEGGYLTSNAKKLLPKNVDVYITHWTGKDFAPTKLQEQQIKGDEREPEPVVERPVGPFRRKAVELGEFKEQSDNVFPADELADKPEEKPQDVAPTAEVKSPWERLTDAQRAGLKERDDMTEEEFNEMSPADREERLSCIGVD